MDREQARSGIRLFWNKAEELLRHTSVVVKLLDEAAEKLKLNNRALRKVGDEFKTLCRMTQAWTTGKYKNVPWKTLVMGVSATIYFVNPLDLIPDFFVGGFVDDVTVLTYVLAAIKTDLDRFAEWEKKMF